MMGLETNLLMAQAIAFMFVRKKTNPTVFLL